jgi:cyanoexosortase B-associated protein
MLSLPRSSSRSPLIKLLVVLFVLAIATVSVIPSYVTGNWAWKRVATLEQVKELKTIQKSGVVVPGWKNLEQGILEVGGHKWSVQAIVPEAQAKTATLRDATILMLRPQTQQRDLPQVDWVDIKGAQRWTEDSIQSLKFSVSGKNQPSEVEARFLRGWHEKQTYAVLQWYAWEEGGSAAPSHWFWTDQLSQLRDRRRSAWVAVSILMPIPPLGEIEAFRPQAEAIGKLVQSTLISRAL